ncbi:diacylglycerol kinase family protein [Streptomyces sp. NBC_00347]|uniref:diacylglycerol kinase family protein n=1 Tax=Streptomyces sp. NBC_00347 TaxID=2975721 RepID=UPI00224F46C2|nr:diacylglycerol kinase family protein [Streptomyces sp. NBC_00347]MCX5128566.1 diacylglycerol kinase family protein [Streptomyces sp. NBC_00347]
MKRSCGSSVRGAGPLLLLPVQAALMIGLGRLVTGPAAGHRPLSAEASFGEDLAEGRDPAASGIAEFFSVLAGTRAVVVTTLVCIVVLLVLPRAALRTEALFLGVSVAAQSAVFVVVTAFVDRPRPAVPHEDAAPPTSSFPSGHVGASLALYGGLAVIAALRMRGPWRHVVAGTLLLIPPAVGLSRMYRGMHYPSDVAGGLINGTLTLLITGFALLYGRRPAAGPDGTERSDREVPAPRGAGGPVLVVRHPYGCPDELADRLAAVLREHGHRDLRWIPTSAELPCGTLAEGLRPVRPALVVVCGGDGTLRACAEILAGTRIPLAVVPCGTGNLLARNLGLPMDPAAALAESLSGESFGIDVGRVRGDGLEPMRFTVMAGAGFDAAMVRDASPRLKSRMGWAAYVLSALRHLRDPGVRLTVRVDGGRRLRRRARMVVIGNVGTLQGGLPLLPAARPDSGRLEVVLFDPHGPAGWLTAAGHLAARLLRRRPPAGPGPAAPDGRSEAGGALEYFSATRIDVRCAVPQPRELDGDAVSEGVRLTAEVEPGALRVYLPRAPGAPKDPSAEQLPTAAPGTPS